MLKGSNFYGKIKLVITSGYGYSLQLMLFQSLGLCSLPRRVNRNLRVTSSGTVVTLTLLGLLELHLLSFNSYWRRTSQLK